MAVDEPQRERPTSLRTRAWLAVGVLLAASTATVVRSDCAPLADAIPGAIPQGPFMIRLENVVTTLEWPVDVAVPDDGSGRIFVTCRAGKVVIVQDAVILSLPFLDITGTTVNDAGSAMSSIAFHPQFSEPGSPGEGLLYTISQEAAGSGPAAFGDEDVVAHQSVVYEWRASPTNADLVDPGSRREILRINERSEVHNVNELLFGPDGFLYIVKGDDDADAAAQLDGTTDDGSIFRIDVDDPSGNGRYSIPPDNPFLASADDRIDEILAYGFRNPWRAGFDRNNGVLYVADIGEDDVEEIDVIEAGGSYGWIEKEGSFVFLDFAGVTDDSSCLPPGFESIDPIAEYDHTEGDRSITGGFVYRGSLLPDLVGHYVFSDWVSGRLFHVAPNVGLIREIAIDPTGDPLGPGVIGFGEDSEGELLLITGTSFNPTGRLIRVVGLTAAAAGPPPGVPDGTTGAAMRVTKLDPAGDDLSVEWDTVTCEGLRRHQIVYGWSDDLPTGMNSSFSLGGSRCDVGITSPFAWRETPAPSNGASSLLWWLMVSQDGTGLEGSWGKNAAGLERLGPGGGGSSGECGVVTKSLSNNCGQ